MTSCANIFYEFSSRDKLHEQEDLKWKSMSRCSSGHPSSQSKYLDQSSCNEYWRRKIFALRKLASFETVWAVWFWSVRGEVCVRRFISVTKSEISVITSITVPSRASGFVSKYLRRERSTHILLLRCFTEGVGKRVLWWVSQCFLSFIDLSYVFLKSQCEGLKYFKRCFQSIF